MWRCFSVHFIEAMNLPLARRYESFHADVFSGVEEPLLAASLAERPEMELQSLWFAGEFGSQFTSTDGRRVSVREWGVWNAGAGPDFIGCAVQVGEQLLRGDIELDPDARDWERHQHGSNPAYNSVVLHLFTHAPDGGRFYTRTCEHHEVAQVLLKEEHLRDGLMRPTHPAAARLGRCAAPLSAMGEAQVTSLIRAAAQYRLERKSRRLHQWVAAQGREQAVFQALSQALGYKANAAPFLMLAQRLQVRTLRRLAAEEREALLFGASGFLESVAYDEARGDTKGYLRELWQTWWRQRADYHRWSEAAHRLPWRTSGSRPGNHPQRRLGALAALLNEWKAVLQPLREPAAWDAETWTRTLLGLRHVYWDLHYTLLAPPAQRPVALLGETRVQEMLANVVYPLLIPDRAELWEEYEALPALLDNGKVKLARTRLFADPVTASCFKKRVFHQQGLLQLYEDFCLEDDSGCVDCPFPERLQEWR
jgi:hypothetical protein